MKLNEIYSYVYDFISIIFENYNIKNNIRNIILFGSVAREDFDKNSDIDLFFDVKNESDIESIENSLRKSLSSFEIKAKNTWNLKGINLPIKFIIGNLDSKQWSGLREDIISNGISLLQKFEAVPKNIKHYALFYFSLSKLQKNNKMKFIRLMFGYKNIKTKTYIHEGHLEKINGIKLGPNNILVPLEEVTDIKKIFRRFKITPKIIEVWVK